MKKEGVLFSILLLTVLLSLNVLAQTGNLTTDEKAYSCLETRVTGKCSSLPFEDQAFALLALGYKQNIADECRAALGPQNECWPTSGGCKVASTSVGLLALNSIGTDITSAKAWLISKTRNTDRLNWYLQIDTASNSTCKVNYGNTDYTVKISGDKSLTIGSNRCLKSNGYWLSVDKSCFDNAYKVTCDSDFVSSLIYNTAASNTFFVSGSLESSSANGFTEHSVKSKCFSDAGTGCDYLSSLWATFALSKVGEDINAYLPYLFAFADDNDKSAPYAFLYVFTAEDEYRQKLMNQQKTEGYWDFGSGKGKFYDTATALIAFQTAAEYSQVIDTVKGYLSGQRIQSSDGCWGNSVRDTSFLVWALWPKASVVQSVQPDCETSGFYCMTDGECTSSGGNKKENYRCPGGVLKSCCDKPLALKSCSDQLGIECPASEPCTTTVVTAFDTDSCCLTECQAISGVTECETNGGICKPSCNDDEDTALQYSCNAGDVCCQPRAVAQGGISAVWYVVIIFLIALVVVGIIYRNRIRVWLHNFRKGKAAAPATVKPRPPYAPYAPQARPMATRPVAARPAVSKEYEETMRKLKELSK